MRWPVTIYRRPQSFDPTPGAVGVLESYIQQQTVRADVQQVDANTFYGLKQTKRGLTHRIFMRWQDSLDNTYVIVRSSLRRDGTSRIELFRILRIGELGGRKQFCLIEANMETLLPTAPVGTS